MGAGYHRRTVCGIRIAEEYVLGIERANGCHLPPQDQSMSSNETRKAWWGTVVLFLVHGLVVATWISRIPAVQSALCI